MLWTVLYFLVVGFLIYLAYKAEKSMKDALDNAEKIMDEINQGKFK